MQLIIYNRKNALQSRVKAEEPIMTLTVGGQMILNREVVALMGLTEQNNKIDVCYEAGEDTWYLAQISGQGFVSRSKGGGLSYRDGAMFQSVVISNQLYDHANLDRDFSYHVLVSQSFREFEGYEGVKFWPIITKSAEKILKRKPKK